VKRPRAAQRLPWLAPLLLFHTPVGAHWLTFPDALYLSLVS
jgi:hypothetical protein